MTLFAVCWEQVWPLLWVMWLLHGLFQWLIVFTRVNTGVSGVLAAESCPPEGGTPPPPHHDAPICRISAGPWFPGSSFLIPFFCILCFTKYYFRSLTPRDSLLGASHFFAKLTAWMSDWRPWKVENPWCRQVVLRVLHTCTSSFCTLFPAGIPASHTPWNQSDAYVLKPWVLQWTPNATKPLSAALVDEINVGFQKAQSLIPWPLDPDLCLLGSLVSMSLYPSPLTCAPNFRDPALSSMSGSRTMPLV